MHCVGFDYEFGALVNKTNELSDAINGALNVSAQERLFCLLQGVFPILRVIVSQPLVTCGLHPYRLTTRAQRTNYRRLASGARQALQRIGTQLVAEKKADVINTASRNNVGKRDVFGRDLLSLLIKANMATDIPANNRLSDSDILARTFFIMGKQ